MTWPKPNYTEIPLHRRSRLKKLVFEATKLGEDFMSSSPLSGPFPPNFHPNLLSDTEIIKKFAVFCIKQYLVDKPWPKIFVRFIPITDHPAHVRRDGNSWKIEVDPKFKSNNYALMAIIAHEVAHVVLEKKQLKLSPKQLNEELTDTVSILGGFGEAIFCASHMEKYNPFEETMCIERLGYLQKNEIMHLCRIKELISKGQPIKKSCPVYVPTKDPINLDVCVRFPCSVNSLQ